MNAIFCYMRSLRAVYNKAVGEKRVTDLQPFKGAVGRLVRKHKRYYFLKAVIGMGVMVSFVTKVIGFE